MSFEFTLNGKSAKAKPTDNFGDIFENNNLPGKFQDMEWKVNGQLVSITKGAKIGQYLQPGSKVDCIKKGQQQAPTGFLQQQQASFQVAKYHISQPTFPGAQKGVQQSVQPGVQQGTQPQFPGSFPGSQPQFPGTSPQFPAGGFVANNQQNKASQLPTQSIVAPSFITPTAPIIQQQTAKRQKITDDTGDKEIIKQIKDYIITITDWGKKVVLEKESGEFKATFVEDNCDESEQSNIQFSPNEVIQNPSEQVKLAIGKNTILSTKVIFLIGYKGIAIRWCTGMLTKFQFWVDE